MGAAGHRPDWKGPISVKTAPLIPAPSAQFERTAELRAELILRGQELKMACCTRTRPFQRLSKPKRMVSLLCWIRSKTAWTTTDTNFLASGASALARKGGGFSVDYFVFEAVRFFPMIFCALAIMVDRDVLRTSVFLALLIDAAPTLRPTCLVSWGREEIRFRSCDTDFFRVAIVQR